MGRATGAVAGLGLLALTLAGTAPIVRCLDSCFVDYVALHGGEVGNFEIPDARLNSWILAWVQHSLLSAAPLFDTNAFHPARNTLAGSEHMLATALMIGASVAVSGIIGFVGLIVPHLLRLVVGAERGNPAQELQTRFVEPAQHLAEGVLALVGVAVLVREPGAALVLGQPFAAEHGIDPARASPGEPEELVGRGQGEG